MAMDVAGGASFMQLAICDSEWDFGKMKIGVF
jgi:hypothetical protein